MPDVTVGNTVVGSLLAKLLYDIADSLLISLCLIGWVIAMVSVAVIGGGTWPSPPRFHWTL